MAIKRLKQTQWGQWAGRHLLAWFAIMAIALVAALSLALTILDDTIFEAIFPITCLVVLIVFPVGFSVARDLFEEARRKQGEGV